MFIYTHFLVLLFFFVCYQQEKAIGEKQAALKEHDQILLPPTRRQPISKGL